METAFPQIAFVGGGQMATALLAGLLRSRWPTDRLVVLEPEQGQRARLERDFSIRTGASAEATLRDADVIVWAVKPQVLFSAIAPARRVIADPLHISVAAGVPMPSLSDWLGSDRVIRAMPNTPALVGEGVTGMFAALGVKAQDQELANRIFAATGHSLWVDSDERIDALTAVSGSGPGFVFQFLASFQSAAEMLGFTDTQARELVVRTAAGALKQAASDLTALSTLRDRVTSKGGTTEAGLGALSQHNIHTAVKLAVACAYRRAQELSMEAAQADHR